jgi:hypothetical protein
MQNILKNTLKDNNLKVNGKDAMKYEIKLLTIIFLQKKTSTIHLI